MQALILLALWIQQEPAPPYDATVTVQEAQVRQTQRSLSEIVDTVKEKEIVSVLEIKDGKARVRTPRGKEGWMNGCAILESGKYVAKEQAAGSDPRKGAESHAYAKGFDPETETRLKSEKNLQEEYAIVDRLEAMPKYRRDAAEMDAHLRDFRKGGHLGEFRK